MRSTVHVDICVFQAGGRLIIVTNDAKRSSWSLLTLCSIQSILLGAIETIDRHKKIVGLEMDRFTYTFINGSQYSI